MLSSVISFAQRAFVNGKQILDGVLITNDIRLEGRVPFANWILRKRMTELMDFLHYIVWQLVPNEETGSLYCSQQHKGEECLHVNCLYALPSKQEPE